MKRQIFKLAGCLLLNALALTGTQVRAAVVHEEEFDGDLSGVYSNPSTIGLSPGTNLLVASTGSSDGEDLEYVRVDLPAGYQLSQLILQTYDGRDETGFIGLQSGPAFTFPADDAFSNINNMLGWSHFGPGVGHPIGTDLLPVLGQNGQGFVPPLKGPTYTFWIQQTGANMDYQLDFLVTPVPEPATSIMLMMAVVTSSSLCRRRTRESSAVGPLYLCRDIAVPRIE